MSEARHTDSPWELEEDEYGDWVIGPDGESIAQMSLDIMDEETVKANARLIVAAPELLEEVQRMHDRVEADVDDMTCDAGNPDGGSPEACEHCQGSRYRDRLAALIAKATGQPAPGATP